MLLDNLEASRPTHGNIHRCKVKDIMSTLEYEDQRILKDAIASPTWNTNALVTALRQRGLQISYGTLRRHETKQCNCSVADYA